MSLKADLVRNANFSLSRRTPVFRNGDLIMIRQEKIARRILKLAAAERDAGVSSYEIALALIGATWAWIEQTCRVGRLATALTEFADDESSDYSPKARRGKPRFDPPKRTLAD
jgi:hypothetical protein